MLNDLLHIAADTYDTCHHDGASFIARHLRGLQAPENWEKAGNNPQTNGFATAFSAPDCFPAIRHLEPLMKHFHWQKSGEHRSIPASFSGTYFFTMIVGPQGLIFSPDIRFGLFLQEPDTRYPSHKHAAVEFYFPLSGTALWQKDSDEFAEVPAGNLIHHTSYQPHATTTLDAPLLAFWAWSGDLAVETYSFVEE